MEPSILFLDNHLMVVHKPCGLLAQADETGNLDLLTWTAAYLKKRFNKPGNVFVGLVHRLDRPVSGIMVLARTSKAAARLSEQFRNRSVVKKYFAIVEGFLTGTGTFQDHLIKDGRSSRVVSAKHKDGKHAKLAWTALASDTRSTLVEVELFTGRAHQIRIQFASRGHALLGDLRYGCETEFGNQSLALHAFCLRFEHPVQHKQMTWIEAPPTTWSGLHETAWRQHVAKHKATTKE